MIILIGESGSGKTTILNELVKKGYKRAMNNTTREKRKGEKAEEYNFITKSEFNQMWEEGKLLQRAEFDGEFYGIGIESLKDNVVCISIVDSVKDIKEKRQELGLDKLKIITIYIHVSEEERANRMLKRGDSAKQIQNRRIMDQEKFKKAKQVANYVIENEEIEKTVDNIVSIVKQEEQS